VGPGRYSTLVLIYYLTDNDARLTHDPPPKTRRFTCQWASTIAPPSAAVKRGPVCLYAGVIPEPGGKAQTRSRGVGSLTMTERDDARHAPGWCEPCQFCARMPCLGLSNRNQDMSLELTPCELAIVRGVTLCMLCFTSAVFVSVCH
jgi:hypothetical protein